MSPRGPPPGWWCRRPPGTSTRSPGPPGCGRAGPGRGGRGRSGRWRQERRTGGRRRGGRRARSALSCAGDLNSDNQRGALIELFSIQDRDVSRKLRERAVIAPGLVLVSGTRQSKHSRPVTEREPYASLERRFGQYLTQLVVVEEEGSQVAWRDPLGDLGTAFFPEDKAQAYAASNGYLLLKNGAVEDVVKKQGSPEKDAWSIQEAL